MSNRRLPRQTLLLLITSLVQHAFSYTDHIFTTPAEFTWTAVGTGGTAGDPADLFNTDLNDGHWNISAGTEAIFTINFVQPVLLRQFRAQWKPTSEILGILDANVIDAETGQMLDVTGRVGSTVAQSGSNSRYVPFSATQNDLYVTKFNITFAVDLNPVRFIQFRTQGYFDYTQYPTSAPTLAPTSAPTPNPTTGPTKYPTRSPTRHPTTAPTPNPTPMPTWQFVEGKTLNLDSSPPNVQYSENIYPLILRNETYATFTVPETCTTNSDGEEVCKRTPYCATCILAYSEIDANLIAEGCEDASMLPTNDASATPSDFYFCEGTWKFASTARLVDFQQTYGRVEIWEVDERDTKWLQYSLEFQWNTSRCRWLDEETGETDKCTLLPLTSGNNRTARIEFEMHKYPFDDRDAPFIVVWYDLLSIPYSLRPPLNYTWTNYTLMDIKEGEQFGFDDLRQDDRFIVPIFVAVGLIGLFVCIMIASCLRIGERVQKSQFMLDTRNLKEVFMHKKDWLVVPEADIVNRSRFNPFTHGPYLLVVFLARLAYMVVFTFTFFYLVFQTINKEHFDVLDQYDHFAKDRDNQLKNMSQNVEEYYYNETERMEREVESRQVWCYGKWINLSSEVFANGTRNQFETHTAAMYAPLKWVNLNLTQASVSYQSGDTACSISTSDGAVILAVDSLVLGISGNGTCLNCTGTNTTGGGSRDFDTTEVNAWKWSRSWANWTQVYDIINSYCLAWSECAGWTWIDETTSPAANASFVLFGTLADPINDLNVSGACYVMQRYDSTALGFGNLDNLQNISAQLELQYLNAYSSDVDSMMDSLNGLWSAIQAVQDSSDVIWNIVINRDPAADFEMDTALKRFACDIDGGEQNCTFNMDLYVNCPDCPSGNFSSPILKEVFNYISGSAFNDGTEANNANFSDLVAVTQPKLEAPALPEIDLPLSINFPFSLSIFRNIALTLDMMLLFYRWWKTAGMLATVIRGRDVEVDLKHLMLISTRAPSCCPADAKSAGDYALSAIICIDNKMRNVVYECWKFGYWVWLIFNLSIIVIVLLIMYYVIDQVITEDFIDALGIFDLLTVGLAAQRAVRNEVICTTAAKYNNYTLYQISLNRQSYAIEKNALGTSWNKEELDRVEEWNAYFCNVWFNYHAQVRDVTTDLGGRLKYSLANDSHALGTGSDLENAFDKNISSYWQPFPIRSEARANNFTDITVEIELPFVMMREDENLTAYWMVSFVQFDWSFDSENMTNATDAVPFSFEHRLKATGNWLTGQADANKYDGPLDGADGSVISETQQVNVKDWNQTRFMRITFQDVGKWLQHYRLNGISVYGNVAFDDIRCPRVNFKYYYFDANEVTTEYCPVISPIFGIMYRGFVRTWLADALFEAHKPFIRAFRNIALSPFFILIVMVSFLLLFTVLGFFLEWLMRLVDLYRENPYSRIPLVTSEDETYDEKLHELEQFEAATVHRDYYRASVVYDPSGTELTGALSSRAAPMEGIAEEPETDATYHYASGAGGGGGSSSHSEHMELQAQTGYADHGHGGGYEARGAAATHEQRGAPGAATGYGAGYAAGHGTAVVSAEMSYSFQDYEG
jgi:hypothetical protein